MRQHPWTLKELTDLQKELNVFIEKTMEERPGVRPLPPMLEDESRDLLLSLTEASRARLLTDDEIFMIGQLLSVYRMAVEARMLKKPGRYYVISEAQINGMLKGSE